MSRPRRLHITGGTYLVTLRGNTRQTVVADDDDRAELERLIELALQRCHARCHAYCWLPDCLFLAIQISDTSLGQFVPRFTSRYARHIHQRTGGTGHLFARRYHATLIEPGPSLLHLVRYIHRAPVRAKLVAHANDYPWSSHRAYLGHTSAPWPTPQLTLRLLSDNRAEARRKFADFVESDTATDPTHAFDHSGTNGPLIIGSDDFKRAMSQRATHPLPFESLDQLIDWVCRKLRVKRDDVLSMSRHRRLSRARAMIAWYATRTGLATLKQVAGKLSRHTSTLSFAMNRYHSLEPELFKLASAYQSPSTRRHKITLGVLADP